MAQSMYPHISIRYKRVTRPFGSSMVFIGKIEPRKIGVDLSKFTSD
jgi:hypothetical protein